MTATTISPDVANVLAYVASFEMFKSQPVSHEVSVGWVANNHGFPYKATCSCGWESRTYAAEHAAQTMADGHLG